MTDDADQLRAELERVFGRAEYPVEEPMDLVPALPDGPGTTFDAGEVSVGVLELGGTYAEYQTYPYETADALVADLMEGFRAEGLFE